MIVSSPTPVFEGSATIALGEMTRWELLKALRDAGSEARRAPPKNQRHRVLSHKLAEGDRVFYAIGESVPRN